MPSHCLIIACSTLNYIHVIVTCLHAMHFMLNISHYLDTMLVHSTRKGIRYASTHLITKLEDRANSESDNAKAQAQYLEVSC